MMPENKCHKPNWTKFKQKNQCGIYQIVAGKDVCDTYQIVAGRNGCMAQNVGCIL